MRLTTTTRTCIAASAATLALTLGAVPAYADGDGKSEVKGRVGTADKRLLTTETTAGRAADRANPAADTALTSIQSRIAEYVRTNGTRYSFGSYLDPASGAVVVETDAPANLVSTLVDTRATTSARTGAAAAVQVRQATASDTFSRRDDVTPYWGGAGITATTGVPWCSAGFTVRNAVGTRSMVTAGHCFSNGTTVRTEIGGLFFGTVSGNGLPSQDMELIGGSSYGSSIYVGGVNSSTGNPVVAAADPVVGFNQYCHSGRTTGENCGHTVTSVNAQVCTSSGCKSPVIAFTGGTQPAGGDSGAPFYAKSGTNVHIRGIIIAGNGVTSYAEKWSRISGRFGVSIAT